MQLIEVDSQLLIRIGTKNRGAIEEDERLSKFNCGSRVNYSIETAILKKRLTHDITVRDEKPTMHNISDLKAYYDRQLPNAGCLVQKAMGVTREVVKVFTKVLPIIEYHVCANHKVS